MVEDALGIRRCEPDQLTGVTVPRRPRRGTLEETGLATTDMAETPDRRAGSPADASEPPRRREGRRDLPDHLRDEQVKW